MGRTMMAIRATEVMLMLVLMIMVLMLMLLLVMIAPRCNSWGSCR